MQDILDNTTAVIFVKDLELRYILVNREYERRFRVKRDEIYGKSDFDIHPRDVAETLRANDRDVIKTGTPMQFEEAVPDGGGRATLRRGEVSAAGPLDGALRGLRYRHGHHGVERDLQASRARQAALRADIHAAFSSGPENALQTMLQLSVEAVVRDLDGAFARIWTLDERRNVLKLQASASCTPSRRRTIPRSGLRVRDRPDRRGAQTLSPQMTY